MIQDNRKSDPVCGHCTLRRIGCVCTDANADELHYVARLRWWKYYQLFINEHDIQAIWRSSARGSRCIEEPPSDGLGRYAKMEGRQE